MATDYKPYLAGCETLPCCVPLASGIDHTYTHNIVCPYCGHENQESWDFDGTFGETDCPDCEKVFEWRRETVVYYTTTKVVSAVHEKQVTA